MYTYATMYSITINLYLNKCINIKDVKDPSCYEN